MKENMSDYKFQPHNMTGKVAGKSYCVRCGLVALNNEFTRWSVDKGCNSEDHPDYQRKRQLTGDLK
jgi:hypothetical protein